MRILLILTFLFLFFENGMAQSDFQSGYIITFPNDTVQGLVQHSPAKGRDTKVEFKASEANSADVYDAGMIAGFGYAGIDRYFGSFELPGGNGKVFAEMLVDGKADLYAYDDFFYIQKDTARERIDHELMRESNQNGGRYVYTHKTYIGIPGLAVSLPV